MEQNRFNQLSKYEDIYNRFKKTLTQYLKFYNAKKIYDFNLKQKALNPSGFDNNLIENDFSPSELLEEINSSYLSRDYLKGEIGLIDAQDQYDGIFNIVLYTLITNRLGKLYQDKLKRKSTIDDTTRNVYKETYKKLMLQKDDATTKLIYSLFIYTETENDNDFFYGYRNDDFGDSTFVIDLPVYGQISVHFGSQEKLQNIEYIAKQNINLILEKKLKLGQITEEQFTKIKSKVENEGIIPEYRGKLYEYSSAIPLDYCGEKFEIAQKDLNLSRKMISDIKDEDIKRISENRKYNSRELYYFAIKSDFSKDQLEKLSSHLQERDSEITKKQTNSKTATVNVQTLGRQAVSLSSARDRKNVCNHEDMSDTAIKNIPKEK